MRRFFFNPLRFDPMAVTFAVAIVYIALIVPILIIHTTVPAAPKNPTVYRGLNLSEAWLDLAELSNGYHPFNSKRNDEVRDWLLRRIEEILDSNKVEYYIDGTEGSTRSKVTQANEDFHYDADHNTTDGTFSSVTTTHEDLRARDTPPLAVIFNDLISNYTSTALTRIGVSGRRNGISTYFEGSNIIVYIKGTEDEQDDQWWMPPPPFTKRVHGKGGVMVNAHFDSVSTGYGATDDGMGVISALQLIRYFTTSGNTPKRGVVALFNNGEEDGLYGAKAFLSHPLSDFIHAFLNLEGAGAGGRATLFRSTDTEVTRAYSQSPHPFGTVVSADGFSLGFVRSETDYVVFKAEGYRGLDVAFWEPRSRYHTDQDDARHASKASLWHMLSASVKAMEYLASDTNEFVGPRGDGDNNKVHNGWGTDGVWFDLFGTYMAVFRLRTLFAWSLTLLIASPLILLLLTWLLVTLDRYYLFSRGVHPYHITRTDDHGHDMEEIDIKGWHGAFRFPIVFIVSAALTVGATLLVRKLNPLIVYSSQYSVWAMSLCLFFTAFWFLMAGANHIRPTALHRVYSLIWMFAFGWVLLVAATVFEDRFKISGGYMFVIYEFAIFLATFIGLCELFALPPKQDVLQDIYDTHHRMHDAGDAIAIFPEIDVLSTRTRGTNRTIRYANDGPASEEGAPEADETTPLVGRFAPRAIGNLLGSTFSKGYKKHNIVQSDGPGDPFDSGDGAMLTHEIHDPGDPHNHHHHQRLYGSCTPYGHEQMWSARIPSWTWGLQFLILAPVVIVIIGQVGLLLVTATAQTGTDGSPIVLPYLVVALFSVLILLPVAPFMHRIKIHLPGILFCIFVGTLLYNLLAFPFSENNRYKAYFQQTVDLDTGINHVTLIGIEKYIREIISQIPSAAGQNVSCVQRPEIRSGLEFCSWEGLAPRAVNNIVDGVPPEKGFQDWLTYNVTRKEGKNEARFHISGRETKACIIRFDQPFTAFDVLGAARGDGRWANVPESGSDQIKLWHRDWDREWVVDVAWPVSSGKSMGEEGRSGRVVCLWSDHNEIGAIPALDEAQRFAPKWAIITKIMDGLVEGSKPFVV